MKNKVIRYALNGVILAAVAAIGVAAYQIGTTPTEENIIQEMESTESEELAKLEGSMAEDEDLEGTILDGEYLEDEYLESEYLEGEYLGDEYQEEESWEDGENASLSEKYSDGEGFDEESNGGTESVNADVYDAETDEYDSLSDMSIPGESDSTAEASVNSNLIDIQVPEEEGDSVNTSSQSMLQQLHFSEETEMEWPAQGTILVDYNMTQTVYFPTLDQYKLSPAIAVQAEEGTPVLAAASGMIYDIVQNVQTGTTVTMELGDGYQAIYGQLKDLTVEEGEMIEKGTVIGYIDAPTKYYTVEGSNLYFSMKRNGEYVDPTEYLPE